MDLKEIQTLIKFISSSLVDEVSIEQKDFKINIKRNLPPVAAPIAAAPQQITVSAPAPAAALPPVEAAPVTNTFIYSFPNKSREKTFSATSVKSRDSLLAIIRSATDLKSDNSLITGEPKKLGSSRVGS